MPQSPHPVSPQLHYRPPDGWVGDVHPVFYQGKWHVYFLKVPLAPMRSGLSRLHSSVLVSHDLIHWTEQKITLGDTTRAWWAVANLVVGDKIYSFYNGPQGFDLAISADGKHWTPFAGNPVLPYPPGLLEIRDPFVVKSGSTFHLVVAGRKRDIADPQKSGIYLMATSSDLLHWSPLTPLYDPGDIGIPECPDLFQMGDRYYLLGSWGVNRVGQARYRVARSATGPWLLPGAPDSLDSTEVMAPNTAQGNNRRVFFGWIPTYIGQKDGAPFEWAGHLAFPRELYRENDGTLHMRLPREFLSLRAKSYTVGLRDLVKRGGNLTAEGSGMMLSAGGIAEVRGTWGLCEIDVTFTLATDCPNFALTFRDDRAGATSYRIAVDQTRQQMTLHRTGETAHPLAVSAIRVASNNPIHLRIFLDGSLVEAFLDDRYALAGRVEHGLRNARLGVAVPQGKCLLNRLTVHTLKSVYPRRLTEQVNLTPAILSRAGKTPAVMFPQHGANVYTPFDAALNFSGSFTLACRINVAPHTGGFKANLIAKGDGGEDGPAHGYHYGLNLTHRGGLELYYRTTSGFEGLSSAPGSVAAEGRWVHVAGVVDLQKNELRLYRDGMCIARKQAASLPPLFPDNRGALRLGYAAGVPNADPFYGLITQVRLWNAALSDADIAALHTDLGTDPRPDAAVVAWDFAQASQSGGRVVCQNQIKAYPPLTATLFDGARLNLRR